MKYIRENIHPVLSKFFVLGLFCLFSSFGSRAQDSVEAMDEQVQISDTLIKVEQEDTTYEKINYFEPKYNDTEDHTVHLRKVPVSVLDSLKKDDAFWYADRVFKKRQEKEIKVREAKPPSQWMSMTTLVVIIVIFLGLLTWYLFENNIIARKPLVASDDSKQQTDENIFAIDYTREIAQALSNSNYRLVIRLMFLRLLKNLSEKNIIQYRQERTNFDYLSQLYSTSYYSDFFRITRNYEYSWYGKFDVSAEAFEKIKHEFENLDRKLS